MSASPPRVLPISEQLTFSTLRIETTLANGRKSTGTGFFYAFLQENGRNVPAIVTNKHVINGAVSGRLVFSAVDENSSRTDQQIDYNITNFSQGWIPHPRDDVDLCILPFAPHIQNIRQNGATPHIVYLDASIIPTEQQWNELTPLEDVIMIGYPDGIWDQQNNLPIIRKGITATAARKNYNGKNEFLIDAAVFPGLSGSPVFIFNQGSYSTPNGLVIGTRLYLIGITFAVYQHTTTGDVVIEEIPTAKKPIALSNIPNNLGLVIRSTRLAEFEPILREILNSQAPRSA